ncbi:putative nucleoside-diphosphate-sugar epimerase [Pediococcus damnosus]|uniref:Nucleoside-diphosphate-sugar epimerase n=2 Tax=Pediococcus damnosus TaxID=51663 RepID=A0AAC9B245_9LACO|nr:NAD(P)H-binding protein [Pediococcus damnosus]AMV60547.1 putative nucleoside-diphosphate-sugar epimerase [Pediococcus damnosus]AMV62991.1 putative nucleoside-diphosphate-sugar epimerase [Pediococcus damnosus]AMV64862.1 putative nucleoside-diphosphate-sugar epimerase [Pediococcus damnosus]AMV67122.1 putative nucleoside-diphosphate-sugar epimerase [Pediococcus damnosus]AMV69275.1 putative nucleoside-diphosphate-sugar epimerase [Pediococcus damnosus]
MKRVLVMGINNLVGQALLEMIKKIDDSELQFMFIDNDVAGKNAKIDFQSADQLAPKLKLADILVINTVDWDADYMLDAIIDAIEMQTINLDKIIFRTVAGVNDEYPLEKIQIAKKDPVEFIKQQQYAGKLVDESEIPYTIIRPSNIAETTGPDYKLIEEGQSMQDAKDVSAHSVAKVMMQAIQTNDLLNQSIGICG